MELAPQKGAGHPKEALRGGKSHRERRGRRRSREAAGRSPHLENRLQFVTLMLTLYFQPNPGPKGSFLVVHKVFPAVLKL